jgi:signal peptidase II
VACIVGGGAGNVLDRLASGHVRDFAVLHVGPLTTGIFNVADVTITLGCGVLVILSSRSGRSRCDAADGG